VRRNSKKLVVQDENDKPCTHRHKHQNQPNTKRRKENKTVNITQTYGWRVRYFLLDLDVVPDDRVEYLGRQRQRRILYASLQRQQLIVSLVLSLTIDRFCALIVVHLSSRRCSTLTVAGDGRCALEAVGPRSPLQLLLGIESYTRSSMFCFLSDNNHIER
jgi:hypothetical protein